MMEILKRKNAPSQSIPVLHAFCTKQKYSGNPAAVITNFTGNKSNKQNLATELNLPVTVFLSTLAQSQPTIEFFYPTCEMSLCLHGTIAAGYLLLKNASQEQITLKTVNGALLPITKKDHNIIQTCVAQQPHPDIIFSKKLACELLNCASYDIDNQLFLGIASVGSPKLFIPVKYLTVLNTLQPNFELIRRWSIENNINGIYIYTQDTLNRNANFHARAFNPKGGQNEDAATGVAAAALASVLKQNITVEQGYILNRPSKIIIDYITAMEIWVGGACQKVTYQNHI